MIQKPSLPKGTRDFSPMEMNRRNYIFNIIKSVFEHHGYRPIETPSMENLSTLLGKYGEEGDKLVFRVLNSGDFLSALRQQEGSNTSTDETLSSVDHHKIATLISEKGLRYDLTVPFARYVVQHKNEITFPFKRYQIQPVWRADRPQKGRYREFYQCDADVIGSDSLINEAELLIMADEIFNLLNIEVVIKINNRKILSGIAELIGHSDKIIDITVAIDKLDKIGLDKVNEELESRGLDKEAIKKLQPIINFEGSNHDKLASMRNVLSQTKLGLEGISEIEKILYYTAGMRINSMVDLDLTLARGLNYYTGAIIEVKAKHAEMGSISGGGRYDNLTGIFGLPSISGVGISFGADRIYDVMLEKNLFPVSASNSTKVLVINFGEQQELYCLNLAAVLRNQGINTEYYPENTKIKKQFSYADSNQIPWVVIAGETELANRTVQLKNMRTGIQQVITPEELLDIITKHDD